MISCRNLLIYMDIELQDRVIPIFHYALVPNGVLVLGSSETIARQERLFQPLDRSHRIFVRRDGPVEVPSIYRFETNELRRGARVGGPNVSIRRRIGRRRLL
jgi:two-component system CheB/CheR fusion protein